MTFQAGVITSHRKSRFQFKHERGKLLAEHMETLEDKYKVKGIGVFRRLTLEPWNPRILEPF